MNKPPLSLIIGRLQWRTPLLSQSSSRGFTLIEVLVTLAVMAVLATLAIPSMAAFMDSIRLRSASNTFFSHLHLARSEAVKRNSRVVLCKSADGVSCVSDGGWEQGWIVFHDANTNAALDSGETVIHRAAPLAASLRFTGNTNVARYVSFAPTGATQLVGGAFQAGTFTVCRQSASSGDAYQIILNAVGRPRVQKVEVSFCV